MKTFSVLSLALVLLVVMATSRSIWTQAAGRGGCCTAYSRVDAVAAILRRGGTARCRPQGITEGCSINAVVMKWKRYKLCVNPTARRMRKLLATLCTKNGRKREREREPGRPRRRKTILITDSPTRELHHA